MNTNVCVVNAFVISFKIISVQIELFILRPHKSHCRRPDQNDEIDKVLIKMIVPFNKNKAMTLDSGNCEFPILISCWIHCSESSQYTKF